MSLSWPRGSCRCCHVPRQRRDQEAHHLRPSRVEIGASAHFCREILQDSEELHKGGPLLGGLAEAGFHGKRVRHRYVIWKLRKLRVSDEARSGPTDKLRRPLLPRPSFINASARVPRI